MFIMIGILIAVCTCLLAGYVVGFRDGAADASRHHERFARRVHEAWTDPLARRTPPATLHEYCEEVKGNMLAILQTMGDDDA